MSKKLPVFKSDKEAEKFLDQDLSDYLSVENLAPYPFEYRPKQNSGTQLTDDDLRTRRTGPGS